MFAIRIMKTITYPERPALTFNRSTVGAIIYPMDKQNKSERSDRDSFILHSNSFRDARARCKPRSRPQSPSKSEGVRPLGMISILDHVEN